MARQRGRNDRKETKCNMDRERAVDQSCVSWISCQHVHSPPITSRKTRRLPSVWCSQGVGVYKQTVHNMHPSENRCQFYENCCFRGTIKCLCANFFGAELSLLAYCRRLGGRPWPLTSGSSWPCWLTSYKWQHYQDCLEEISCSKQIPSKSIRLNEKPLVIKVNVTTCPSHSQECYILLDTPWGKTSGAKDRRMT